MPLLLSQFINKEQLSVLNDLLAPDAEERDYFAGIATDISKTINTMPKTYDTEDTKDPMIHLHYFYGGWDWYIIERDMYEDQNQAFGLVKSTMCPNGELGYISIPEILSVGAELDYYWTPKTVSQVKGE